MRAQLAALSIAITGLIGCGSSIPDEPYLVAEQDISLNASETFGGMLNESSALKVTYDEKAVSVLVYFEGTELATSSADAGTAEPDPKVPLPSFVSYVESPSKSVLLDVSNAQMREQGLDRRRPIFTGYVADLESAAVISWPLVDGVNFERGVYKIRIVSKYRKGKVRIVTRRKESTREGTLDLNLFYVSGSGATASNDADVQAAVDEMYELLDGVGVQRGVVQVFEVPDSTYASFNTEDLEGYADFGAYAKVAPNQRAANVFFVRDLSTRGPEGGSTGVLLGVSSGIPGALGLGQSSHPGVFINYGAHELEGSRIDPSFMGRTIAHEVGHLLGLFHTTEAVTVAGRTTHDLITDTPECPASADVLTDEELEAKKAAEKNKEPFISILTADECKPYDATNMMFWQSSDNMRFTSGQGYVLRRSVVVKGESL